jgi:single-strand DNA-binding protein
MPSFNKVLLMGNLTRDPELRYTATGVPVSNLRMAVNRSYKTQAGEERQETCFINVVVLGKSALPCSEYLAKGSGVFVEGRLQSRSWESEGQKRSVIEVVANNVQFMTMKGRQAPEGEGPASSPEEADSHEAPAVMEETAS